MINGHDAFSSLTFSETTSVSGQVNSTVNLTGILVSVNVSSVGFWVEKNTNDNNSWTEVTT